MRGRATLATGGAGFPGTSLAELAVALGRRLGKSRSKEQQKEQSNGMARPRGQPGTVREEP